MSHQDDVKEAKEIRQLFDKLIENMKLAGYGELSIISELALRLGGMMKESLPPEALMVVFPQILSLLQQTVRSGREKASANDN